METNALMVARDVERALSNFEFAATLRRLADSIEQRSEFEIELDGEYVQVPLDAACSIEHERSESEEELEFQLKWTRFAPAGADESSTNEEAADALS